MSDSKMKHLNNQLVKLKSQIEKFNPSDDISKDQEDMDRIEDLIKEIDNEIDEIDNEIEEDEDLKAKKPLLDKVSEQKNEFEILKNNYNKKKDAARSAHSKELLMQGKLTGVERKKAQRDMALDQVKEVDEQGLMLNSIHDNVKGANTNLENMNVEVKKQGEQLDRIGDKVITIDQSVKKTGEVMGEIERRNCCRKCSLVFGIIVLFLVNIIMVFLILAKLFGWGPIFPLKTIKDSDIEGIELPDGLDLKKFKKIGYTFVMIKSGTGLNEVSAFKDKMNGAREKKVEVGTFWEITASDETTAIPQVEKAINILETIKDNLKYDIYLKIDKAILEDTTLTNTICKNLTDHHMDCGIALSYEQYKTYYRAKVGDLQDIKNYWIIDYNKEFKEEDEKKVFLWKLEKKKKIDGKEYDIFKAREKK